MSTGLESCADVERFLLHSCSQTASRPQERPALALDYKIIVEPPLLSATITDLCNEPLFSSSYLSDEEDCSASEADDMSISTGTSTSLRDDDFARAFEATLPELLAEECTFVERQCSKAQAVMLVAAGRPKIIQVAEVDIRSSQAYTRSSTSSSRILQRSVSSKNGMPFLPSIRQHSRMISRSSSSTSQEVPATPEMPGTPLLEDGLRTPMSARTPLTPDTTQSRFRFGPFSSPTPLAKQNPFDRPQVAKRSKSSLSSLGRPSPPLSAPPIYSYAPKTVARGGDDHSSFVDLPPFPSDAAMPAIKPTRPWALRKDSFGPVHHYREGSKSSTKSSRLQLRKTESTISLTQR